MFVALPVKPWKKRSYSCIIAFSLCLCHRIMNYFLLFFTVFIEQPAPILINCNVNPNIQDPFCANGISPNFCARKPSGIYDHPSFCNRFVQCHAGRVFVTRCRTRTLSFNPIINTCGHAGFFRCNNIRRRGKILPW